MPALPLNNNNYKKLNMKTLKELFSGFKTKEHEVKACCGGGDHAHQHGSDAHSKMVYQCPMKCEGNKTYEDPGHCPVCNMDLKIKE